MTTYWKSLPRYYCKYCNFWCVDNKINIQKHESSEIHRANLDRYLSKQKVAREREAAHEKEVAKIIKKAESDALESMNRNNETSGYSGRKFTSKKNSYYMDSLPTMHVTYDTVPTPEQWQASLNNTAPVIYNENMGNVPPPPPVGSGPVVYNESMGNVPPPPPVGSGPVIYDENAGSIPPPPPVGSGPVLYDENASNVPPPPPPPASDQATQPPIKYNFDYESKLTEEDLFGSWKTVSVTQLTEQDLAKREEQYDKEVMKSSKQPIKKGVKQVKKVKKEEESEDEDEKDAFDMFNPFGGKYKGVDLSASDPVFNPSKKIEILKKVPEEEPIERVEKEEPKQFISTNISFSFAPKKPNTEKKEIKPKASSVTSFFSYFCFFITKSLILKN